MASMQGAFAFEDGGRFYTCRVEGPHGGRPEAWWWFGVSDDASRYAPFRAAVGDTEVSVRARVIAYDAHRRARHPWSAQHWESALWRQRWERELVRS
jgi:hypothetical protein